MPTSDLTHARMHEIIDSGESFLHDGQVISTHDKIPAPESLAVMATDKSHVKSALLAERDALNRRLAELESDGSAAEKEATAAAKAKAEKEAKSEANKRAYAEKQAEEAKARAEALAKKNAAKAVESQVHQSEAQDHLANQQPDPQKAHGDPFAKDYSNPDPLQENSA